MDFYFNENKHIKIPDCYNTIDREYLKKYRLTHLHNDKFFESAKMYFLKKNKNYTEVNKNNSNYLLKICCVNGYYSIIPSVYNLVDSNDEDEFRFLTILKKFNNKGSKQEKDLEITPVERVYFLKKSN